MASLPPVFKQRYFTASGAPLVGGKIYTYQAGTTTPLPSYTDNTETFQNANPTILDANGECDLWLGSRGYKVVLTDSADVVQWTKDNVRSAQSGAFETIQPLTTKGQLITHTGVESTPRNVGTDDQVLTADSADTTGLTWRLPHPLTTKGDVFTRGSALAARLPVGSDGQVIRANSSTATGLEWQASDPLTTKGDLFVRNASASTRLPVGTDGQTLVADSATAEGVKWAAATGGGGSENYIPNPSAENNTTGWTLNNITPAPFPSGALLGSPAGLTLTRNTTNALNGVAEFQLAKDGSNRQGQMVLANFTVPPKSRAKVLSIRVPYRVLSGTFVNSTSKDIASLGVYIREFDGTNYTWTEPSSWRFLSNSTTISDEFRAEFQTLSTTISADLVFYVGAFATGAWTLEFDDVVVGPSSYVFGTPITDWTTYTPTGTWTGVTYAGRWRRVGDSGEYAIGITMAGAPSGGGQLYLNLPSGQSIDTTKRAGGAGATTANIFGTGKTFNAGSNVTNLNVQYGSAATNVAVGYESTATAQNAAVTTTTPFTYASGMTLDVQFTVPISGWSSSVQMSSDASTRVVSFSGTQTTQAVTANTTNISFTATANNNGAWNGSQFVVEVPGDYMATGTWSSSVAANGGVWLNGTQVPGFFSTAGVGGITNGSALLTNLKSGDLISFRNNGTATITLGQASVFRLSGPSAIAASETVAAKYNLTSFSGTVGVVICTSKIFDTHNAYSTSTGLFTAPIGGLYEMSGFVQSGGTAYAVGGVFEIYASVNGVGIAAVNILGGSRAESTSPVNRYASGSTLLRLVAGDTVSLYLSSSVSTAPVAATFNIKRIGL